MSKTITTLEDLAVVAQGAVVELPPFAEGIPFVARLRRPSLMLLAKSGKIPNTLLEQANSMFFGQRSNGRKIDQDALKQTVEIIEVLCEAAFVEPTYKQLKENGIELTDDQLAFVYEYTQKGVNALSSFRPEQEHSKNIEAGNEV